MTWTANIVCSDNPGTKGSFNVTISVEADSKDEALEATTLLTNHIAGGRIALFRARPEADSDTNFATKITRHVGYSRFTVCQEAGEWSDSQFAIRYK